MRDGHAQFVPILGLRHHHHIALAAAGPQDARLTTHSTLLGPCPVELPKQQQWQTDATAAEDSSLEKDRYWHSPKTYFPGMLAVSRAGPARMHESPEGHPGREVILLKATEKCNLIFNGKPGVKCQALSSSGMVADFRAPTAALLCGSHSNFWALVLACLSPCLPIAPISSSPQRQEDR